MCSCVAVAVIDDHDVIHAGLAAWFSHADPPIRLIRSYYSADSYLCECSHGPAEADADVVLLDLELTSRHIDFSALEDIVTASRRVIVFSHIVTDEIILTCLDLGVVSYVTKTEGREHLISAIHAAKSDIPYVAPRMAGAMFRDRTVGRPDLPAREREVLIAWFQTENKDLVADRLRISPSTVRTHLERVRAKYAAVGRPATTKAALVARAIQDGIINIDEL
jgi:DNA-binding NarL/FixJ family response regulator